MPALLPTSDSSHLSFIVPEADGLFRRQLTPRPMESSSSRLREDSRRPRADLAKYLELVNNCDEDEPLLSESPLGRLLDCIPLDRVPPSKLIQLNQTLNVEQLIPTPSGLARDYRGLAELMGFSLVELEARFRRSHNPAKCLIEAFSERTAASLNDLLRLLESLERFDIVDDLLPTLIDLVRWHQAPRGPPAHAQLEATGSDANRNSLAQSADAQAHPVPHRPRGAPYDAFVCFANEDEDHARELILLLERHNKRVVTMEHLLPGQFEYDALVQLIATECRKVIILLTPNFLQSRECEFQAKFANEIAIKSGWFPKIIPVLCEPLDDSLLPPLIRVISKIDMTHGRASNHQWQLRKLLGSLEYDSSRQDSAGLVLDSAGGRFAAANRQTAASGGLVVRPESALDFGRESVEPIIDLAYSQSSDSALNLNSRLSIMTTPPQDDGHQPIAAGQPYASTPSPNSNHHQAHSPSGSTSQLNPLNWYKSFKRKVLPKSPCDSIAPSTSSRAKLIQEQTDEKN